MRWNTAHRGSGALRTIASLTTHPSSGRSLPPDKSSFLSSASVRDPREGLSEVNRRLFDIISQSTNQERRARALRCTKSTLHVPLCSGVASAYYVGGNAPTRLSWRRFGAAQVVLRTFALPEVRLTCEISETSKHNYL